MKDTSFERSEPASEMAGEGDFNADGFDDVVVAPWEDEWSDTRLVIHDGPIDASAEEWSTIAASWSAAVDYLGIHVDSDHDLDGDGQDDVFAGVFSLREPAVAYAWFGNSTFTMVDPFVLVWGADAPSDYDALLPTHLSVEITEWLREG